MGLSFSGYVSRLFVYWADYEIEPLCIGKLIALGNLTAEKREKKIEIWEHGKVLSANKGKD